MTRRRVLAGAAALLALLAAALVTAPARLLPLLVDTRPLLLTALEGTLWQGSASRAVVATEAGFVHLGRLDWRLHAGSLLTLRPRVAIAAQWGQQRIAATLERRAGEVRLRDVDAAFDARLARRFAPVDLRGRFELQLQKLWLAGALLQRAQGRALWRQAAWVGPGGQRELGDYVALLETPQAGDVRAELETLSGPVTVAGSATLRDRQYSVDARIDARGGFDADLAQALSLVAAPGENGYLLRLDGVLAGAR